MQTYRDRSDTYAAYVVLLFVSRVHTDHDSCKDVLVDPLVLLELNRGPVISQGKNYRILNTRTGGR